MEPKDQGYKVRNTKHPSTLLPRGSQIFIVEGNEFLVPRALLAHISEVFRGIDSTEDSDEPIMLDDSAEAFRDFVDVLFDPFTSCLVQENPDLRQLLHVLQVAHKYCANDIEERARKIVSRMTQDMIRLHLGPNLSALDVFRIASKACCPAIAEDAWDIVLESYKKHKVDSKSLLDEGLHSGFEKFLLSAYYNIMIQGPTHWEKDTALTSDVKNTLAFGTLRCMGDWEALMARLASGKLDIPLPTNVEPERESVSISPSPFCDYHFTGGYYSEIAFIAQVYSYYGVSPYDVVGKLHAC
ncbi:uncharacterized protein EI90DRAFT_3290621, partial [Cantharellus anzutake]